MEQRVIHYGIYGENSAPTIPTACGVECSTWDKSLQYTWDLTEVTCHECMQLAPPATPPMTPEEVKALEDRVREKFNLSPDWPRRLLSDCVCGDMPPGGRFPKGEEPPHGCPVHDPRKGISCMSIHDLPHLPNLSNDELVQLVRHGLERAGRQVLDNNTTDIDAICQDVFVGRMALDELATRVSKHG